jgi:hypothetical protein
MITAKKYVESFYGNKEKAIQQLEKSIQLYEESPRKQNAKVLRRLEDYKRLLSEIKLLK